MKGKPALRADEIRQLFDYSYSATWRVLGTSRNLSQNEFAGQPALPGAWSVQRTLVHMLDAEMSWRERLQGQLDSSSEELVSEHYPDVDALQAAWEADEALMREWLATLSNAAMDATMPPGRKLWQYLAHVVNHSTQHRSEVAMLLTGYGHSPGDLDFTYYLRGWRDT